MDRPSESKRGASQSATMSLTGSATSAHAPLRTPAAPRPRSEGPQSMGTESGSNEQQAQFIDNLVGFTREHKAAHWSGTFATFLEGVVQADPGHATRRSHQYMWDMVRWQG